MDPENLEKYEITQSKCAAAANLLDAFRPLPSEKDIGNHKMAE